MSCIFGENRDIFFPKLSEELHLITFAEIAEKYLKEKGLEPYLCQNKAEVRAFFNNKQKTTNSMRPNFQKRSALKDDGRFSETRFPGV